MIASITKDVPKTAVSAITPMFDRLSHMRGTARNPASHFDWAIHPGGAAILQGAKEALHLTDDHIRASLDVYRHFGNSSSPTVLIVLDKMRRMGEGRDKVIATSFGPGLMIEMCMMRRCRSVETKPLVGSLHGRTYASWLSWQSRLVRKIVGHQRGKMDGVGRTSGRWHSVVR
jgi:type III polyketide synthase